MSTNTDTTNRNREMAFLLLARTALTPGQVNELDRRVAEHANRLVDTEGMTLEDAVEQAAVDFGSALRRGVLARLES